MIRRRLHAMLGCVLCCLALSCSKDDPRPPDLLLITVDALRPDHLGIYGYHRATSPNIDRFFGDGMLYEHAYSTQSNTTPSVISILTGLYPQQHGVRLLYQLVPDSARLLPELLPESYLSAAFVSNFVLTDEATGLAARFDHFDDYVDEAVPGRDFYERNAEATTDAALMWLEDHAATEERPIFLWIHYIDPHGPYRPPANHVTTFEHDEPLWIEPEQIPSHQRFEGLLNGLEYVDRYDEEIAYTDAQVGRLLDGFSRIRTLDEALVVFTADHGESTMEHERWFSHGYHVYEEIIRVPLMMKGPGVEASRRTELVSGIDLTPTILGFTGTRSGLDLPLAVSGSNLLDPSFRGESRTLFAEATQADHQWRVAIAGSNRWIIRIASEPESQASQVEGPVRHYDLAEDPLALEWREAELADRIDALRELRLMVESDPDPAGIATDLRHGIRLDAPKVHPRAVEEALAQLRALGYVH